MDATHFDFNHHSHRRFNPLSSSWVLCSPHRTQRPWQGKEEVEDAANQRPAYDSSCYLCPGNKRANNSATNPDYKDTFIFENDFPAVRQNQPNLGSFSDTNPLLKVESVRGQCHVVCFSPRHDITLADMTSNEILPVIDTWINIYESMRKNPDINHVQIFENKGAIMGCSNPHPHGQVWSTQDIPQGPAQELVSLAQYKEKTGGCMLCDYVKTEVDVMTKAASTASQDSDTTTATKPLAENPEGSRVVCENSSFLCVVPFWATWPFETMLLARTHLSRLSDMNETQKEDLADILRRMTCRYDNLFKCPFPYSMGIHQAPTNGVQEHEDLAHVHFHFYPPLLRSATVQKFLVGFELLAQAQRDITPEQAAKRLSDCSEVHYKAPVKDSNTPHY
ncbi:galactose-1-phosphate uridyl transferase [Lunasporangiospora selenospora]|uniref:Galactose-1-phosphate uridylyltransferase n=1 Tax=Lunasporangiospora selenospora TaxID=979761 RepID=A0A9P6G3C0_9FUNG|nr:galactose-1-phosphate uridyl transferase [Lunasporangiospora selenospora]